VKRGNLSTQAVTFHFSGLFRFQDEFLLLSGEGIQMTTLRMTAVCTYFSHLIDRVLNIGIAGSLDEHLQLNQIYGIHTVYHQPSGGETFPAFACRETHSKVNCVTAKKAVLDDQYARELAKIAAVTDRELWAVGSVCNFFNLPFKSYKLVSDRAGAETDPQKIKSQAALISKHLFDFYKSLSLVKEEWE
jgi:nucleoside phosphorylase